MERKTCQKCKSEMYYIYEWVCSECEMKEMGIEELKWFECDCKSLLASFNSGGKLWCSHCYRWKTETNLKEIKKNEAL